MGLFGLSASEALYLTKQLNRAQERRNNEQMQLMKQHQYELKKMSVEQQAELRELENQRIAQMATEARQMEPLIILSVYKQYSRESNQTISIRASDIKVVESKTEERDRYEWNNCQKEWVGSEEYSFTTLTLWDGKRYDVLDTPELIQAKVDESIARMSEIQTKILIEASKQNKED